MFLSVEFVVHMLKVCIVNPEIKFFVSFELIPLKYHVVDGNPARVTKIKG